MKAKLKVVMEGLANPGSEDAIKLGCKCPVLDNWNGKGRGGNGKEHGWLISGNCPIHAKPKWEE